MPSKSRLSLVVALIIVSLTLVAPLNSLSLLTSAFARTATAAIKFSLASTGDPKAAIRARVAENYGKLPLHFEANRGQFGKDAHLFRAEKITTWP